MFSLFLCFFVVLSCVHYFKTYSYWKNRGIPCIKPVVPIIGNLYDIFFLRSPENIVNRIYNALDAPFGGFYVFNRPVLMVKEPNLIKRILITDFNNFADRGFQSNPNVDPLVNNIIQFKGPDWKVVRPKLVKCFNVNKVRNMVSIMNESATEVIEYLNRKYDDEVHCEFLDLSCRFMVDCVMKTLFGVNSNCVKKPNGEFHIVSKHVLGFHFIKHVFVGIFLPWLHSMCGITICSDKYVKLFKSVVYDNIKFRESIQSNSNDFFHTLMQMKEEYESAMKANIKVDGPVIDDNFIASQVFMFFTAGFESPANAIAFCMYELTQNKNIQEKVFKEIKTVLGQHENQLTYNAIQDMKYLNQVLAETMRKYPALNLLFRECTKDYRIPNTDDITIDAGTLVLIPTYGIHYDAKIFPEPKMFDPDRFNEANITDIHPGTYLPFGNGPRNCIATLYSNINMKIIIIRVLQLYEISLGEKTKVPLGFNPMKFLIAPEKCGVWLKLKKRRK